MQLFTGDMRNVILRQLPSLSTLDIRQRVLQFVFRSVDSSIILSVSSASNKTTLNHMQDFLLSARNSSYFGRQRLRKGVLGVWFSRVKEIHFSDCNLWGFWDRNSNIALDLEGLNLEKLSIDVEPILYHHILVKRLMVKLVLCGEQQPQEQGENGNRTTIYFARDGATWKPTSLFERKTSIAYGRRISMRELSPSYACININVGGQKKLRLYYTNLFDPTISIE